jgi:hypothetical protein
MAVPTTVKIPDPITAPMPSEVSATGPSVFCRRCSGRSASLISLSMDFLAKNWLGSGSLRKLALALFPASPARSAHHNTRRGAVWA